MSYEMLQESAQAAQEAFVSLWRDHRTPILLHPDETPPAEVDHLVQSHVRNHIAVMDAIHAARSPEESESISELLHATGPFSKQKGADHPEMLEDGKLLSVLVDCSDRLAPVLCQLADANGYYLGQCALMREKYAIDEQMDEQARENAFTFMAAAFQEMSLVRMKYTPFYPPWLDRVNLEASDVHPFIQEARVHVRELMTEGPMTWKQRDIVMRCLDTIIYLSWLARIGCLQLSNLKGDSSKSLADPSTLPIMLSARLEWAIEPPERRTEMGCKAMAIAVGLVGVYIKENLE